MIHKTIEIWQDGEYNGAVKDFVPVMDTYLLKGDKKRGAVLVCPGGGYGETSEREAEPIALQFNQAGFHAFVLYYSCAPNRHPQPIQDATRAMCLIREHAEEWQVDADKIAVCGFSAGGHLAASLGVKCDFPECQAVPGMEKGKNRPNAMILCYPVILEGKPYVNYGTLENLVGEEEAKKLDVQLEHSLERFVTKETAPTFLWHTVDDGCVPVESSLQFATALQENKVPFEMHLYPSGPHGLSLATSEMNGEGGILPHVATWMGLCLEWLKELWGVL